MAKPGRSEEGDMDAEQQARLAEAMRQKFADEAPKRTSKPSRSDGVSADSPLPLPHDGPIPEHVKLQQLLDNSIAQTFIKEYGGDIPSEYIATDYYKGLYDADRALHHTTGTGFIQVETSGPLDLSSLPDAPAGTTQFTTTEVNFETPDEFVETEYYKDLSAVHEKALHHTTGTGFIKVEKDKVFELSVTSTLARTSSGGNPATNDWLPVETTSTVVCSSKKPHRSEC